MHGIVSAGLGVDRKRQTSATIVSVDINGERTFFHTRGCMQAFRVGAVLDQMDVVRRGRVFAFGYYGLLPECDRHLSRMFRSIRQKTGMPVLLDTAGNPRRDDTLLSSILPTVDFFVPSYEEAKALTGRTTPSAMVDAFRTAGALGVVGVKLGREGCYLSWQGESRRIPAVKVRRVVDATGAGDAFVAGFIAGILEGRDPFTSARIANAVAASSLSAVGASTAVRPLKAYVRS
jgi:sugar/nucleoside kinase (ribokinase family)